MMISGIQQIILFVICLLLVVKPLGIYMQKVFCGEKTFMDRLFRPVENGIYRTCQINPKKEQTWYQYAVSLIFFSLAGIILVYLIQRLQFYLPFNPQHFKGPSSDLAYNTAESFVGNTNWQAYVGESTMSYFTQMTALAVQNFVSAAVGIAVAIALIRGFARRGANTIGNFWCNYSPGAR